MSLNSNSGVISDIAIPIVLYYRRHILTATGNGGYSGTTTATVTIAIAGNANNDNLKALISNQIADQGGTPNLNIIDTSAVTKMSLLFSKGDFFNGDISEWDVSQVIDIQSMFFAAKVFNGDISKWDVTNVSNMLNMFFGANAFNHDLEAWGDHLPKDDATGKTTIITTEMFCSSGVTNQPTWY